MDKFEAGQLRYHIKDWAEITSDGEVLETISGLPIPANELPKSGAAIHPQNKKDSEKLIQEIRKLEQKGVVIQCEHEPGEFISPIFLTPKSDGNFRMILNLKKLNSTLEKKKFKMQTLSSILCLIRPNMYMAKLDIKDAYYSVPIMPSHQKLFKFEHEGKLYKFVVLLNGYTERPRKFTKAMKPPLARLRKRRISLADYIDDLFTLNKNFWFCLSGIFEIVKLLDKLGFIIHPDKSVFIPTRLIEFLGHLINTISMTISLTLEKKERLKEMCEHLLNSTTVTIREIARFLGKCASSFLAVPHGRLHYRSLERFKIESLRRNQGKFDRKIEIPAEARTDIEWRHNNIII